jgi:hypothetical protein
MDKFTLKFFALILGVALVGCGGEGTPVSDERLMEANCNQIVSTLQKVTDFPSAEQQAAIYTKYVTAYNQHLVDISEPAAFEKLVPQIVRDLERIRGEMERISQFPYAKDFFLHSGLDAKCKEVGIEFSNRFAEAVTKLGGIEKIKGSMTEPE